MTSQRQHILDSINFPQSRKAFEAKLSKLFDAIRTCKDMQEGLDSGVARDQKALMDLQLYCDRTEEPNEDGPKIETDPLTVIEAARRYELLHTVVAGMLRDNFMQQVHAIAPDLTQGQVKQLCRLMLDHNPMENLRFPEA